MKIPLKVVPTASAVRFIILLGFIFLQTEAFCQNDYIMFGKDRTTGLWVVAKKNPRVVYVNNKDGSVDTYTPDEITGFGIDGVHIYYSMNLEGVDGKVFVENPFSGKLGIFRYNGPGKKMFFVEKDSALIRLYRKDYKEKLREITADCPEISRQTHLLRFGQRRIKEFAIRYENCTLRPFPYIRWGILAGEETTWLTVRGGYSGFFSFTSVSLRQVDLKPNTSWFTGIFLDMPIFTNEFSLNLETYYTKNSFSQSFSSGEINIDLTSLDYLILLQYTYPRNKLRPYLNGGYRGSNHLKISSVFNAGLPSNANLVSKYMGGLHFAGGLQWDIATRQKLNFELAYSYLYTREGYFRKTNFSFALGLVL